MNPVIVIPYRRSDEYRQAAFEQVHAQAQRTGIPVIVGDSGDQPFSIARTWNRLAEQADDVVGGWDRLIRWGADFLLADHEQIHAALALGGPYTLAADTGHAQNRDEFDAGRVVFDGRPLFGGPNVVTRELWDAVGGFDERFLGYGAEDYAFVHGVQIHTGDRARVRGGMCALWHPKPKRSLSAAADPYMRRREPNLQLFYREIEPLSSLSQWGRYLAHRYDNGRENPYLEMSIAERRKLW